MSTEATVEDAQFEYCPNDGRQFEEGEVNCPLCSTVRNAQEFLSKLNPPSWRKILYIRQPFPDNYVDSSFLEEMQKNVNVRTYDYWGLVRDSTSITQHLSSIAVFLGIFIAISEEMLSSSWLFASAVIVPTLGYISWQIMAKSRNNVANRLTAKQTAKASILFMTNLLGLSPLLKTLTEDTSSDTIYALTTLCFLANIGFHDYSSTSPNAFPSSISLNAAIFASVLLASRLRTHSHVYSLMSFAVMWFALFPMFRKQLKLKGLKYYLICSFSLFFLADFLLYHFSLLAMFLYIFLMAFITFVCPAWFISLQKYKNEIHGPWDEARLVISVPTRSIK